MSKVLVVLAEGFEEIETITPVDLLRRAGAKVTLCSLTEERQVKGRCDMTLLADTTLAAVADESFDLVVIPGGPGVKHLRADPRVIALAKKQAKTQGWLAAICAAPTVLLDAGLTEGLRFTSHPSVAKELPARLGNERVVVDGNIVTSRGAGTALDFGLALVQRLFGSEKAAEVSEAICA